MIAGHIGENIIINCTSHFPNEALNNVLWVYVPLRNQFQLFEGSYHRLINRSDAGSVTTYTYGPLVTSDNGTIFRCSSSGINSANATIVVTCKYQHNVTLIIIIILYCSCVSHHNNNYCITISGHVVYTLINCIHYPLLCSHYSSPSSSSSVFCCCLV